MVYGAGVSGVLEISTVGLRVSVGVSVGGSGVREAVAVGVSVGGSGVLVIVYVGLRKGVKVMLGVQLGVREMVGEGSMVIVPVLVGRADKVRTAPVSVRFGVGVDVPFAIIHFPPWRTAIPRQ